MIQDLTHRLAKPGDFDTLIALQRRATLGLSGDHYDLDILTRALDEVPILTRDLIEDGHYHVLVARSGTIVAGGGWSRRTPGHAKASGQGTGTLVHDHALVRAVYVDPMVARQGLGRRIMALIEVDAAAQGIRRLSMTATLPGRSLYSRLGYRSLHPVEGRLSDGCIVRLVAMDKVLPQDPVEGAAHGPGSIAPIACLPNTAREGQR